MSHKQPVQPEHPAQQIVSSTKKEIDDNRASLFPSLSLGSLGGSVVVAMVYHGSGA